MCLMAQDKSQTTCWWWIYKKIMFILWISLKALVKILFSSFFFLQNFSSDFKTFLYNNVQPLFFSFAYITNDLACELFSFCKMSSSLYYNHKNLYNFLVWDSTCHIYIIFLWIPLLSITATGQQGFQQRVLLWVSKVLKKHFQWESIIFFIQQ